MRAALFTLVFVAASSSISISCKKADANPGSTAPTCPTCVTADEHGFTPSSVTIPKGAPGSKTKLTFTRVTEQTCAREVVVPDLKINQPLPLNQPTSVEVPADEPHTWTFQCGMAMYKGSVVVK
jgi:plastocyanin domain-containing protein